MGDFHCFLTLTVLLVVIATSFTASQAQKYEATWESLDRRPIPYWYDEAKFGIIMHWGLYSVPSFGSEWFWYSWKGKKSPEYVAFMEKNYPPGFSYPDFAPMFTAEFFNPDEFAQLVSNSGARYYVLTTKHHDGWTNWKSNVSWNYNAVDTGPHMDLVAALANSFREKTDVHFGLYFSLFEWFHPLYLKDQENQYHTQEYVKAISTPQIYDLVKKYEPDVLWTDGDWEASSDYWMSKEFLAWLYNDSPVKDTVVVNDRWGNDSRQHHGGVLTVPDRFNPKVLQKKKWEDATTVDMHSWGYRRNANIEDFQTTNELVTLLAQAVSCGGNLLLNIGPTKEGIIVPVFQERLLEMGKWLKINGEAIYSSRPWRAQKDSVAPNVWYTTTFTKPEFLAYAIVVGEFPTNDTIVLGEPITSEKTIVTMLGVEKEFEWSAASVKGGIKINIPPSLQLPSPYGWVFKLENAR
ncbi:alpha-L-fucosidase-like [Montipora foliosa]|uniref:alpha-L-fucosidase-like n=1 Tax=Montipora foliosa TaxID=591990 RepID=UPI0035F1887B